MDEQTRGAPSIFTVTFVQFLVGIALFVGLLNGQRELVILTLLVLGVVGGARVWTWLSLTGLECRLAVDRLQVFPGEPVTLQISAENGKPLPVWLEFQIPVGDLSRGSSRDSTLTERNSLWWYQGMVWRREILAERRGVFPIGPVDILAGDLFAFFSRRRRMEEARTLYVFPRLIPFQSFLLPRRDFFGIPKVSSPVQDPIYILGTRDYQYGQPSKHIHWKASARRDRLQEKLFEPTVREKILLVVDVGSFAQQEAQPSFERALELVASMAVRFERQGNAVGLLTNGAVKGSGSSAVPIAKHAQQLPAILETLAGLEMRTDGNLQAGLEHLLAHTWGVSCVYLSYREDETILTVKDCLNDWKTPVVFVVCEPRLPTEIEAPDYELHVYRLDDICQVEAEDR